jgi:hypothetical protein
MIHRRGAGWLTISIGRYGLHLLPNKDDFADEKNGYSREWIDGNCHTFLVWPLFALCWSDHKMEET